LGDIKDSCIEIKSEIFSILSAIETININSKSKVKENKPRTTNTKIPQLPRYTIEVADDNAFNSSNEDKNV